LNTPAFGQGEAIPVEYTCDGADNSPPLEWSGVPAGAQSLALIADDPDAPRGTWVHWVFYNLPPALEGLEPGVEKTEQVPGLGLQGVTDFRRPGYGGPCPPPGSEHRYFFRLYALDIVLGLPGGATRDQLDQAMQGHILAQGEWMGVYAR
jgi:Raf kinase inhibitor-like YbhB/YbcL family protein